MNRPVKQASNFLFPDIFRDKLVSYIVMVIYKNIYKIYTNI